MNSINVKKIEDEQYKVSVLVDKKRREKAEEKSIQKVQTYKKINGFRKGKVPAHIIRSRFPEEVNHETIHTLLDHYWNDIRKKLKSDIYKVLSVNNFQADKLEFTCVCMPYVELCKLKETGVEHYEPIAEQKDIEDVIEKEKVSMGMGTQPKEKSDGTYERLDCLDLEIQWRNSQDRETDAAPNNHKQKISIILGRTENIEGLDDFILSEKPALNTEFKIPLTRDGLRAELIGKIISVARFDYPEINDEFAKKSHLKAKSMAEYKKLAQENLIKRIKVNIFKKQLAKIIDQCKQKSKISISNSYLESLSKEFLQGNPAYKKEISADDNEKLKLVFKEQIERNLIYKQVAQIARKKENNYSMLPNKIEDILEYGPVNTNHFHIIVDKLSKNKELSSEESNMLNSLQEMHELSLMRNFLEKEGVLQRPLKKTISELANVTF